MTIFPKWLLNTDKIPNPKGPFPKMLKKIPGNGFMDDLRFYVLFNCISVTDYVRVIMMELLLRLERFPPPLQEKSNLGWITCHFMFFQTVFRSYPPAPCSRWESNQGWITCHFTFFQTVFRSYQDDEGMMMKGCVKWNTVYDKEDFNLGSPRAADQRLTH